MYDQCDVREAVHEFQEYLSDRLPPLGAVPLVPAPAQIIHRQHPDDSQATGVLRATAGTTGGASAAASGGAGSRDAGPAGAASGTRTSGGRAGTSPGRPNDGHLGRAGVMFDLAEELIAERPIAPAIVESLRQRGCDQLAVPLVKQVIAYLSATRHERAERALVTFLHVFETMLLQPEQASYAPAEVEALLDRTCVALARLAEAGRGQDLSTSPEIGGRLLAALSAELPRKVPGFSVRRNDERVAFLIQALSGTPSPEVVEALQAVVDRYPGQKTAEEAQRAMATLKAAARGSEPPAGLAGDLELFGLPDVLQTLAGAQQTGVLTLMCAQGSVAATVLLEGGRFRGGQYGAIEGRDAVYQLFERPFPGTFAFVSRRELPAGAALVAPCELVPLMLEGVRRHDELRRAAALVPDGAALEPSGAPWSPLTDEDAGFAGQLWQIVAAGTTSEGCEAAWSTDSYRVRRLLAHWAEEGALRIAAPGSSEAPANPVAATEPAGALAIAAATGAAEAEA